MTATTSKELQALRAYEQGPMSDGDALLLVDESMAVELEGMADAWEPEDCLELVPVLSQARRVVLAVARQGAELQCTDYELGACLRAALEGVGVAVLPVQALRAAR